MLRAQKIFQFLLPLLLSEVCVYMALHVEICEEAAVTIRAGESLLAQVYFSVLVEVGLLGE